MRESIHWTENSVGKSFKKAIEPLMLIGIIRPCKYRNRWQADSEAQINLVEFDRGYILAFIAHKVLQPLMLSSEKADDLLHDAMLYYYLQKVEQMDHADIMARIEQKSRETQEII